MEEKNKTYTAVDFDRYYSGNMKAKDMHELEKAAMKDPFLADALEGYAHTPSAVEDIQHLKSAIAQRTARKKVFSIGAVSQNIWWRVAAIFILVGIAGYFIFNEGKEQRSLAKQEISALEQEVAKATPGDSMNQTKELALGKQSETPESVPVEEKTKTVPSADQQPVFKPLAKLTQPTTDSRLRSKDTAKMSAMVKGSPLPAEDYSQITQVQILDSLTISAFSRNANKEREILLAERTNHSNKKTLKGKPALAYAKERRFDSPKMLLRQRMDSNDAQVMVHKQESQSKKAGFAKAAGVNLKETSFFQIPDESALKPRGGLKNFQDYLVKNRAPVRDQKDQPLHGRVHMQFNIDQEGKPENISILKSDCADCEKQAVELLKNGPFWEGDREEKGILILIF